MTDSERLTGSRKPSQSSVSRPVGFDPERKTFGFIKDDLTNAPGMIGVAIVQKIDGQEEAELIDFRLCAARQEANAYLMLYGLKRPRVIARKDHP